MIAGLGILLAVLTTVRLPVTGGAQETFFLPFDAVRADTSTLALRTPDGCTVPYSLDDRLGFPKDGTYRPPPDGYHSIESAPAKERRYRRLGWLSFRAPAGVSELELSFGTGGGATVARPDPSVRPRWVSLLDPAAFARRPREVSGGWIVPADALPPPARLAGRPFLASLVTAAVRGTAPDVSNLAIRLPNASRDRANLIQLSFRSGEEPVESLAEAVVAEGTTAFSNVRRPIEFNSSYSPDARQRSERPLRIDDLILQSPPGSRPSADLHPASDLYDGGDVVRIPYPDLSEEYLADFPSSVLPGVRVRPGSDSSDVRMALVLTDGAGRTVRRADGNSLALGGLRPGRYALRATLLAGGAEVARTRSPIEIQPAPAWKE